MAPSVDHWDCQGTPLRFVTEDGMKGIRQVHMAWSDVGTFLDQIWDSGNNRWPAEYDSNWAAYIWKVKAGPMENSQSSAQNEHYLSYNDAVLTLEYNSNVAALNSTGVVSETFDGVDLWQSLGHRNLMWNSGQVDDPTYLKPDEQSTVQIATPKALYIREEKGVISIPSGCVSCIGHTNNTLVHADVLGINFPAGTLMYKKPRISRQFTTEGYTRYRIIHTAEFDPQYWNKFLRKATGQFEYVYNENGEQFEYPTADLNTCYSK